MGKPVTAAVTMAAILRRTPSSLVLLLVLLGLAPRRAAAANTYDYRAQIASNLLFEWSLDAPPSTRLHGRLTNVGGGGWAALGTNGQAVMGGTDALLFEPGSGQVSIITMAGHETPARVAASVAAATLDAGANFTASGSSWVAEFSRKLAAGAYAGARAIPASGDVMLVAAWGGSAFMAQHSSGGFSTGTVNLATGAWNTGSASLHAVHGFMMAAAWAVIVPGAVALLRYGRVFGEQTAEAHGARANWHGALQCLAVLLTCIGAIVAVSMVPATSHFSTTHGVVGIFVVLGAVAQPCVAYCCHPLLHRAVGVACLALGAAALYLGLQLNGVGSLVTLYFCVLAIALAAVAALESRGALKPLLARCCGGGDTAGGCCGRRPATPSPSSSENRKGKW